MLRARFQHDWECTNVYLRERKCAVDIWKFELGINLISMTRKSIRIPWLMIIFQYCPHLLHSISLIFVESHHHQHTHQAPGRVCPLLTGAPQIVNQGMIHFTTIFMIIPWESPHSHSLRSEAVSKWGYPYKSSISRWGLSMKYTISRMIHFIVFFIISATPSNPSINSYEMHHSHPS